MSQGSANQPIELFISGGQPQFTGGVAYETMFQTSLDTTYTIIQPGLYKINVDSNIVVLDIELPNLLIVTNSVIFTNNTVLTTIAMPVLNTAPSMTIDGNNLLTSLNLSGLTTCTTLHIGSNPVLASLSLPIYNGDTAGSTNIANNSLLTSLLLPEFVIGDLVIASNALSTLDLSSFIGDSLSAIGITDEEVITSIDLSSMTSGGIGITGCTSLTTLDISAYAFGFGSSLTVAGCTSLTTLVLNSSIDLTTFALSGNALDLTSVDGILATIDGAGQINGTLDLSGGTNASPTGGAANVNKVSLEGKGWTVTIN